MVQPVAGRPIVIKRFWATADPAEDSAAVTGAATTDIAGRVLEASGITEGIGNAPGATPDPGIPLEYAFTPLAPDLTIDSPEDVGVYPAAAQTPVIAVSTDSPNASTVVVTIEYERD